MAQVRRIRNLPSNPRDWHIPRLGPFDRSCGTHVPMSRSKGAAVAATGRRQWRAALVAMVAGIALPLPAPTGQALAAPAGPSNPETARAVAKKVEPAVRAEVTADGKSTFWVILGEQANLN